MKKILTLKVFINSEDADTKYDKLEVEGKELCSACELWETPEDAYFGRDLLSSYDVAECIKKAIAIYVEGGYTDVEILFEAYEDE